MNTNLITARAEAKGIAFDIQSNFFIAGSNIRETMALTKLLENPAEQSQSRQLLNAMWSEHVPLFQSFQRDFSDSKIDAMSHEDLLKYTARLKSFTKQAEVMRSRTDEMYKGLLDHLGPKAFQSSLFHP